ncbi:LysR family transcriptional regulator [Methylocystis rosea]|uniref:LysR family transcriptional regulator n=1 Tax=Methylocystis rosea TaxID=173366 RepID=A0A3G8MB69_9HYPH|nr:LysR family transcriptional regulator [Methylocystis rosea]AZG78420.1 LysR family transcriptional regulator [Methylocystis rosea]
MARHSNPPRRIRQPSETSGRSTRKNKAIDFVSISQALLVADHASVSHAARALGVRQSAVSRRVQALENELGVSLFERQLSGVRLTVAGKHFFDRTRAAFAEIDHAVANALAAGRGAEGMIRIGVLPSTINGCLSALLYNYRAAHPAVAMEFYEGPAPDQIARIMERLLDVAFLVDGTPAPGCDIERYWTAGVCVALSDQHPLTGCDIVDWDLLKDEHFILGREAIDAGLDRIAADHIAGFGGRMSLETHDISQDAVMKLVVLGFGLGLVNDSNVSICYPGVAFRRLPRDDGHLSFCAVWLPGNDNPAMRRFLSLARSMLQERSSPKL